MNTEPPFVLRPLDPPPVSMGSGQRTVSRAVSRELVRIGRVREDQVRWPARLVEYVAIAAAALRELPAGTDPETQARAVVTAIAAYVGPGKEYWPSADKIRNAVRDWRIYNQEFTGRNLAELAERYHMSLWGMAKLLKRQREYQIAASRARRGRL